MWKFRPVVHNSNVVLGAIPVLVGGVIATTFMTIHMSVLGFKDTLSIFPTAYRVNDVPGSYFLSFSR